MSTAIAVSRLDFSYEKVPVLQNVSIEIMAGEFIGVIGPNGGGKTTLLKLLMGFLTPESGEIRLFGRSPISMRQAIGYVPQFSQTDREFPITVLELVLLGSACHDLFYPAHLKEKALHLLEELNLISYRSKPFSSLSGGLAQRALLARALLSEPSLLFLDEPTANIDPVSKEAILEKLHSFKRSKTILLVTHDLKTIIEKIDKILCLQTQLTTYLPNEVCEHFALGLYHTPLLKTTTAQGIS